MLTTIAVICLGAPMMISGVAIWIDASGYDTGSKVMGTVLSFCGLAATVLGIIDLAC